MGHIQEIAKNMLDSIPENFYVFPCGRVKMRVLGVGVEDMTAKL
jgi:hypothetical protein